MAAITAPTPRSATDYGRHGSWMQSYANPQFYPLGPRPEGVVLIDVAHALSMQCRHNGRVQRFMFVAEHCVLISRLVSPENVLWGLLHDVTEGCRRSRNSPVSRTTLAEEHDPSHQQDWIWSVSLRLESMSYARRRR
ncbi:hypothetical protein [Streptomyces sp. NPDC059788]|uniref:hypothetical protein n=1 Tax=Streptomyces sp. NPDC059788 TaxID=3346948 RepID=UPI003660B5DC